MNLFLSIDLECFFVEPDAERRDLKTIFPSHCKELPLSKQQCIKKSFRTFFITGNDVNLFSASVLCAFTCISVRLLSKLGTKLMRLDYAKYHPQHTERSEIKCLMSPLLPILSAVYFSKYPVDRSSRTNKLHRNNRDQSRFTCCVAAVSPIVT